MNQLQSTLFAVGCAVVAGCGMGPTVESRAVTGQLSAASLSRLDNPAVVARSADGAVVVARVARTGDFEIAIPVGVSTRLTVAGATPEGGLREDSTIVWPNRWSVVAPGTPIDVGVVRPRGADPKACGRDPREVEDDACPTGKSDLPYDAKIPLGASFKLTDAFLEKGPAPAKIVSVTMDGSAGWRLGELKANTVFVVTKADCDHAGNRDQGRDRVIVTWQNADGSQESDHLDLRYCDGSVAPSANAKAVAPACGAAPPPPVIVPVCDEDDGDESVVDDGPRDGVQLGLTAKVSDRCAAPPPVGAPIPPGPVTPAGGTCSVTAGCAAGLACFQSKCVPPIN